MEQEREKTKDFVGKRFGKLTVISVTGRRGTCRCDCGSVGTYTLRHLRSGAISQCGCVYKARMASRKAQKPRAVKLKKAPTTSGPVREARRVAKAAADAQRAGEWAKKVAARAAYVAEIQATGFKRCGGFTGTKSCGQLLSIDLFQKDPRSKMPLGLASHCNTCRAKTEKAREARRPNEQTAEPRRSRKSTGLPLLSMRRY
jgi:hypothetical protein